MGSLGLAAIKKWPLGTHKKSNCQKAVIGAGSFSKVLH